MVRKWKVAKESWVSRRERVEKMDLFVKTCRFINELSVTISTVAMVLMAIQKKSGCW